MNYDNFYYLNQDDSPNNYDMIRKFDTFNTNYNKLTNDSDNKKELQSISSIDLNELEQEISSKPLYLREHHSKLPIQEINVPLSVPLSKQIKYNEQQCNQNKQDTQNKQDKYMSSVSNKSQQNNIDINSQKSKNFKNDISNNNYDFNKNQLQSLMSFTKPYLVENFDTNNKQEKSDSLFNNAIYILCILLGLIIIFIVDLICKISIKLNNLKISVKTEQLL